MVAANYAKFIVPGSTSTAAGIGGVLAAGTGGTASGTDATVTGSGNTASGVTAAAGGTSSVASGNYAKAHGSTATASGPSSTAFGSNVTASGASTFAAGNYAQAVGTYSTALGARPTARWYGALTHAGFGFAGQADAQVHDVTLGMTTTDATPTQITANISSSIVLTGEGANVLTIPVSRAWRFHIDVIARSTSPVTNECAGWNIRGIVLRETGSATLPVAATSESWKGGGTNTWDAAVSVDSADATNNYLKVTVTGAASRTVRWLANVRIVEVA